MTDRPRTIALPGPFVDWLETTSAFPDGSPYLVELRKAVRAGRHRKHGPVGYTLTIALEPGVLPDLREYAAYFDLVTGQRSDHTSAEARAVRALNQRLADLPGTPERDIPA